MRRLSIPLLAALLVLTGCGGDAGSPAAEPGGTSESSTTEPTSSAPTSTAPASTAATSSPTAAPSQATDPAARRTLRKAQLALLAADTGTVETLVALGPNSIDTVADYQLSSRSMSSTTTISSDSDGPLTADAIAIGKQRWFRISQGGDDPKVTCWMLSLIHI